MKPEQKVLRGICIIFRYFFVPLHGNLILAQHNQGKMATPSEKLAESLEAIQVLQDQGIMAIKTSELSRVHRERLLKNGFLKEVAKGWYLLVPAHENKGDSTSWYASYWHFCSRYLADRYGDTYCLSANTFWQLDCTPPTYCTVVRR